MNTESARSGHPLLAAVFTLGISGAALAQPPVAEPLEMVAAPVVSPELELLKEEETVSIASAMSSRSRRRRPMCM